MIHEILESLAEDTHGDTRMTCTHPTETVRKEKRGERTEYTCEVCGAKKTHFKIGRHFQVGKWSDGREAQERRFDDLMEKLTDWALETGNEVLVVKTGREDGSYGYQLMGEHSGQMEKAVKWVQGSLFEREHA